MTKKAKTFIFLLLISITLAPFLIRNIKSLGECTGDCSFIGFILLPLLGISAGLIILTSLAAVLFLLELRNTSKSNES